MQNLQVLDQCGTHGTPCRSKKKLSPLMKMILRYQQQQDQESVNWNGLWSHMKLTGPHIFSGVDFWFLKHLLISSLLVTVNISSQQQTWHLSEFLATCLLLYNVIGEPVSTHCDTASCVETCVQKNVSGSMNPHDQNNTDDLSDSSDLEL